MRLYVRVCVTYPEDAQQLEPQWLCRRLDGCEPGKRWKRQVSAALESGLLANSVGVQPNIGVLSKAPQAMFQSAICDVLSKAKFGMSATCACVSTSSIPHISLHLHLNGSSL